jgi:hypothetical protein
MDDFDQFVTGNVEQLLKTAYLITWDAGEGASAAQSTTSARGAATSTTGSSN